MAIDSATLYAELKPDIGKIADPLFELSTTLLKKLGNFLPHGAALTEAGEVKLVAAAPENKRPRSTEVLPLLHDGLRYQATQLSLSAVGVAENVTITPKGLPSTKAIKVLFEHKRGLTVALYLPFEKKLFRGYVMGSIFSVQTAPEVNPWRAEGA